MKLVKYNFCDFEEYLKEKEFASSSELKTFFSCPASLKYEVKASHDMYIGTAFELLVAKKILGLKEFDEKFYITDLETKPTNAIEVIEKKNAQEHIKTLKNGKPSSSSAFYLELEREDYRYPLTKSQHSQLESMFESISQASFKGVKFEELYKKADRELAVFWEDGEGRKKKARLDFVLELDGVVYPFDLKTTSKPLKNFSYTCADFGYWIQAVHYQEGLRTLCKDKKVMSMTFLVVSKKQPFDCQFWKFEENESYEEMEEAYQILVDRFFSEEREEQSSFNRNDGIINIPKRMFFN